MGKDMVGAISVGKDAAAIFRRIVAVKLLTSTFFHQIISCLISRITKPFGVVRKVSYAVVGKLLAWLDFRKPHVLLSSVLAAAYFLRRYRLRSLKAEIAYRKKFWSDIMKTALTYDEWAHAASMVDKYTKRKKDSDLYDEDLVRSKLEDLRRRRLEGGVEDIIFALRTDLVRNLGNMCNPELHKGRLQTPLLIREYINEVRYHLRAVCEVPSSPPLSPASFAGKAIEGGFPLEEKLAFIHETRHAFGRTALLLSGGAALGAFHLGVMRTLIEHRVLPRVLSGASVGSIICSFAATRTWDELLVFFDDPLPPMAFFESMGSVFVAAHRLLTRGAIADIGHLQRKMRQLIGDLTFQEAYDVSGRVLGVPVCSLRPHEPPRLLNYLTSPHVVIWSAVSASCAFPFLFEAQELMAKDKNGRLVPYHLPTEVTAPVSVGHSNSATEGGAGGGGAGGAPGPGSRAWRDGSLQADLPMGPLKEMFNVNHFIVSQANPHIAPMLRLKDSFRAYAGDWAAKLAHLAEMELKHRCQQAVSLGWDLGGLPRLFSQEWEGDITIVMPATLAQFAKIIQNPTPSELRKAVLQGRRTTWAKLSAIQANCGIELMLDECVSELSKRRKAEKEREAAAATAALAACAANAQGGRTGAAAGPGALSAAGEGTGAGRLSGTRRIPSWNSFARESSWGSLEEVGGTTSTPGPTSSAGNAAVGTSAFLPGFSGIARSSSGGFLSLSTGGQSFGHSVGMTQQQQQQQVMLLTPGGQWLAQGYLQQQQPQQGPGLRTGGGKGGGGVFRSMVGTSKGEGGRGGSGSYDSSDSETENGGSSGGRGASSGSAAPWMLADGPLVRAARMYQGRAPPAASSDDEDDEEDDTAGRREGGQLRQSRLYVPDGDFSRAQNVPIVRSPQGQDSRQCRSLDRAAEDQLREILRDSSVDTAARREEGGSGVEHSQGSPPGQEGADSDKGKAFGSFVSRASSAADNISGGPT